MTNKPNVGTLFPDWRTQFAAEVEADDGFELRRHVDYLGLDCSPTDMMDGTNILLFAVLVCGQMDNKDCKTFLWQQRYRLCGEGLLYYCLTFNFGVGNYGRVLSDKQISFVDFADLLSHPWTDGQTVGFKQVSISRLDGRPIDQDEIDMLKRLVADDIYTDFTENEFSISVTSSDLPDTVLLTITKNGV